jgi:hypothetical protein
MMGIIYAGMVVKTSDGRGKAKLAQPGNREWSLMRAFVILAKGTMAVMHQITLLQSEVSSLRKANEAMSKRRRAKRTRVRLRGSIAVQDAKVVLDQQAIGGEVAQETQLDGGSTWGARTRVRRSGVCGKSGHNVRTCQEAADSSESPSSDVIIVHS